ncbi:MAG: alkaline phosphatase family protein [Candidatus Coatesbacteria bacterium]|nr:alkaline phosphatase family protein [Candidatus Coatesbacteria bacterium]
MAFYVLGLDGTPFSLISEYIDAGIMPNFKSYIDQSESSFVPLLSSYPPISSVAWTSFMTASNPAEHGIFGFMDFNRPSYSLTFPNSKDRKKKTLWEIIAEKNMTSAVINLPSTYPATPINGLMVSGFVALELEKSVYPLSFYRDLKDMKYRIDVDLTKAKDLDFLVKDLIEMLEIREKSFRLTLKDKYDLWIGVITETDRLLHFMHHAITDKSNIYHSFVMEYFNKIDKLFGRLVDDFFDENPFIMLSDHGFTGLKQEIYINNWLIENNLMVLNKSHPASIEDISGKSLFMSLDPGRIYLNKREIFENGLEISEEDCKKYLDDLESKLFTLKYNNEAVIEKVFRKEDIYKGEFLDIAPDMVILPKHGYDLKARLNTKEVFNSTHITGCHTYDNAFRITNQLMPECISIQNVGEYILNFLLDY